MRFRGGRSGRSSLEAGAGVQGSAGEDELSLQGCGPQHGSGNSLSLEAGGGG